MNFNLNIAKKLPAYIVGVALVTGAAMGVIGAFETSSYMRTEVESKLVGILDSRKSGLNLYLKSIEEDLKVMSADLMVKEGLVEFSSGFSRFGVDAGQGLQDIYIDRNKFPAGEKQRLDMADDGSFYSQIHGKYHPSLRTFQEQRDYYDVFLVNPQGDVVYSVFKELDFATNLSKGKWRDTGLAAAFKAAMSKNTGDISYLDFQPYAPSANVPAGFIATKVVSSSGGTLGALILQMPIGKINGILQGKEGLGESGESYIVGGDLLMRSDSRFSEETNILKTKVDTLAVQEALAGESGIEEVLDYRGVPVLSAYSQINYNGTTWAIMTEIDKSEALESVSELIMITLYIGIGLILLMGVLGYFLSNSIVNPMNALTSALREMGEGNDNVEIPYGEREDELGQMSRAVTQIRENSAEKARVEAEEAQAAQEKARIEEENARKEEERKEQERKEVAAAEEMERQQTENERKQAEEEAERQRVDADNAEREAREQRIN
ncbi:MAG: cache and HAMP domain-containing protein [Alphaproteobacteria bacterium]|jgi:methyl-accepting chemotaxis protein|nr:cache and HAMP domain-containing protein [Alphaproteobacteria bacterium]MBT4086497.1 cache and HAMP domain-containing protein [Alphaproteobacteria bacterium]MBT4546477.1 cache and HAMP domain-containing protein [Alphaproteobacteria bacterium]MBT7745478.1 cache and HAMP domain-containing protein [Alphaproteobacteria bacterium]